MSRKDGWKPISALPASYRDGRPVMLRRVHERRIISEGIGRWAARAADAPGRKPIWTPAFQPPHEETQAERDAYCDRPGWVTDDRLYVFPEPTHWREDAPAAGASLQSEARGVR